MTEFLLFGLGAGFRLFLTRERLAGRLSDNPPAAMAIDRWWERAREKEARR